MTHQENTSFHCIFIKYGNKANSECLKDAQSCILSEQSTPKNMYFQ